MERISKSIILVLFGLSLIKGSAFGADPFAQLNVIKPKIRVMAPAFTLKNLSGGMTSLKDFKGKVVILNFWATWCAPCREEMPAMEKLWDEFKDKGVAMVAISADRGSPDVVRKFVEDGNFTFHVLLDPEGKARKEYEVAALPTTYIIGPDGLITGRIIGSADWEGPKSRKLMEILLK